MSTFWVKFLTIIINRLFTIFHDSAFHDTIFHDPTLHDIDHPLEQPYLSRH